MNKKVILYCEGTKGSHDYDILEKVIKEIVPSVTIKPIGGIRGAGAIIQYIKSNSNSSVVTANYHLLFRDRDFDKKIPDTPCLEKDEDKKYIYWSYRNTIENYLFEPDIFYAFIESKKLQKKYQIDNREAAKGKFIEAAEIIKFYQATRHALDEMRTGIHFESKWVDKSGKLPEQLDEKYCRQQALQLIANAKLQTETWTEQVFEQNLTKYLTKFNVDFMNRLEFLIWFQGKDFATALTSKVLNDEQFPLKSYYKFSKKHFDYTKYPDLLELQQIILNPA